jgi:hypothetical protein
MALNPVAYTEKVVSNFLRYQLTAYPFADPDLSAQMRRLLSLEVTRRTPLLKGPYVSLSRAFRAGTTVQALVGEGVLHPHLRNLVAHAQLYGHQERAIRAIVAGRTTLISTGTGSGKTECFLYPIISRCLRLRDEGAPPGIVAVLVYPMNALAEDQLGRLRDLLAGTGIPFAMYVGKTPEHAADVPGQRLRAGSSREDYRQALARAQAERRGTAVHPPEERCSREEMRTPGKQPRILLTNVKQLELLLTRHVDAELFDGTQLDFVVFDEAHTFGGALGAEAACLIRRLRAFCGRGPGETACVATSATIADPERGPEAAREFAARFFGVPQAEVTLVGEEYEPDVWAASRAVPPPLSGDVSAHLRDVLGVVDAGDGPSPDIVRVFAALTESMLVEERWQESLHEHLARNELVFQLAGVLSRPRPLGDLLAEVATRVGRPVPEEEALVWLAFGAAARSGGRPLLRPVIHAFVRGIGGAVVSFPADEPRPRLWLSAQDEESDRRDGPAVRLPVMTCSTCGQHYFVHHVADFAFTGSVPSGGDAAGDTSAWRPLDASLGGKRVVMLDRTISAEDDETDPPRTAPVFLCRACGALHPRAVNRCEACGVTGPSVALYAVAHDQKRPGWLTRCVSCGAPGRAYGSGYREPARPVRAVPVSDVHVLAQDMVHNAERRRLLVFADNRQEAAFQAGWMRDHARRYRLRALMAERIGQGPVSVGDLAAFLDDALERDDALSQALVPEVWNVHRKESEGVRHAEERKRFLRIQVLREIATGVKQRIGLEPWGRLRVDYRGLDASGTFVVRHAEKLRLSPEALVDGVAGLLDLMRRGLHLLDREGKIFSRFWQEGDFELQRGYLPPMPGVPKGLKLERAGGDDPNRITQWLSARGDTVVRQAARKWGIEPDQAEDFVRELWQFLSTDLRILAPVTLMGARGRALPGCAGAFQIDADQLKIAPQRGLWRCRKCRRAQVRPAPHDRCLAWRCDGTLAFVEENADNYDLGLLDGRVEMIRPYEHSAQVPAEERERLERWFKGEGDKVNTLVCTPTLELGVDIGALDAVLLRNVPPLPANYWQRTGRAGRRHRMAVNITYARPTSHDRAYFAEPEKLLGGLVEPPRFNMKNEPMVAKHVHATVLTRLHQLARPASGLSEPERSEISETLNRVFPRLIRDYLFDEVGNVRATPFDISPLERLLSRYEEDLVSQVTAVFSQGWPPTDQNVVEPERLRARVRAMTGELGKVVGALKKRLEWALHQLGRLDGERRRRGTLDPDEDALHRRCDRLVKRLKGQLPRRRTEAEGYDDVNTFNVLAAEGFLPGYGLEVGAIIGTAHLPRYLLEGSDFELPRPPAVALREYVPGNLIYANGHRFVVRYLHLEPTEEPIRFQVDWAAQSVSEIGTAGRARDDAAAAALGTTALRAMAVCDVDLTHIAHISDEEDYRFQLPVAVFGYERGRHGAGRAYRWGERDLLLRHGVAVRLVNVGAVSLIEGQGRLGYPICLVCGQSRSPFASQAEREHFEQDHRERCGRPVEPTGLFADVVADAISLRCASREEAYSLLEALRAGATRVLEMERDDLEILVLGQAGTEEVDALLYDPMPGGSGLLDQLCERFTEVAAAALEMSDQCPSACVRACVDCLMTFRNAFFHAHLNRHVVADRLRMWGDRLVFQHDVPPRLPSEAPKSAQGPVNQYESVLRAMLQRAGFPEPKWRREIPLGRPLGSTWPDCYFEGDEPTEPGVCIYLDGLSEHIHGNPATRERDRAIRDELRSRHYEVFEIAASDLADRDAMAKHFFRLGRVLLGRDRARELRDEPSWFEGSGETGART